LGGKLSTRRGDAPAALKRTAPGRRAPRATVCAEGALRCAAALAKPSYAEKAAVQSRQIAVLTSVHRLLRAKIPTDDPNQMPLF